MIVVEPRIQEQFMRIAMARLNKKYCFKPQRLAMAAKMFTQYLQRLEERGKTK
jgi:hypothetical protein